jgi:hypothetical protein
LKRGLENVEIWKAEKMYHALTIHCDGKDDQKSSQDE